VIHYVRERYGATVSQIITYGTMAAKAVVRDAAACCGQAIYGGRRISKLIPFEVGMTLEEGARTSRSRTASAAS
jgi:DNA polymerase-3 subunit alpha